MISKIREARERHKIISTLMGIVGVVLIWRGIWTITDSLPYFNHPWLSLLVGLILVIVSGIFFKLA
ncbi:MAG: hypothetical protein HYT09_02490 [Candidatus Levybacteria bacterium]|nr:hypothetical protein [Candidatus Levybacteria bacterium]